MMIAREQDRSRHTPIIEWHADCYRLRDSQGHRIGDILEANPEFIVAERVGGGFLGSGESHVYYIPRALVAHDDGEDWQLSVASEDLDALGFLLPPVASAFSTDLWQPRETSPVEPPAQGRMRIIRLGDEDSAP